MDKRFNLPFCWILLAVVFAIAGQLLPGASGSASDAGLVTHGDRPDLHAWAEPLVLGALLAVMTALGVRYVRWLGWLQFTLFLAGAVLLFGPSLLSGRLAAPMRYVPAETIIAQIETPGAIGWCLQALSFLCFVVLAGLAILRLSRRGRDSRFAGPAGQAPSARPKAGRAVSRSR